MDHKDSFLNSMLIFEKEKRKIYKIHAQLLQSINIKYNFIQKII
jgi:hypothetical protein